LTLSAYQREWKKKRKSKPTRAVNPRKVSRRKRAHPGVYKKEQKKETGSTAPVGEVGKGWTRRGPDKRVTSV